MEARNEQQSEGRIIIMIETVNYKTRTEMSDINMPKVIGNNQYKHDFIIALDGGYSSVKGISEKSLFCFPSYAKRIESIDIVGRLKPTDIILENHLTKEIWLVGAFAENTMEIKDIQATTDESLYTRYRYKSDVYQAIMMAGLGLGLFKADDTENLTICLQTGLPSAYVMSDAAILKEVLAQDYDFTLRLGEQMKHFKFTLEHDNIGVMEQPRGTLANIVYDKDGHIIPKMRSILDSDTLILDIGFGTEDIFSLRSGADIKDNRTKTFSDTAMRSVFEKCVNEINNTYQTELKIFQLQKYLGDGVISINVPPEIDKATNKLIVGTKEIEFGDILEKYNKSLCTKSIYRLLEEYNNLSDYQNLIVTGGTGESRIDSIREILLGLPRLHVFLGNESDPSISTIYANVRGYYMSMLLKVQRASKAKK
jgi:plasmid segregation protein ParM